jgi:hypothetical protein
MKNKNILLLLLLLSWDCTHHCANKHLERVYVGENYVFFVNEILCMVGRGDMDKFYFSSNGDTLFKTGSDNLFILQPISSFDLSFDTICIVNYLLGDLNKEIIALNFDLKIFDKTWQVDIYHPFDRIAGAYLFDITKSEYRLLCGVMNLLLTEVEVGDYVVEDTVNNTFAGCYIDILQNEKAKTYLWSNNNSNKKYYFDMLIQTVIVIIENHIRNDTVTIKISSEKKLLNVQEQFKLHVKKNQNLKHTVIDLENYIPPPPQ